MKNINISVGELMLLVGTRAMLGAGIALLVSNRLDESQRRSIGSTMLAVGLVTTIPLAIDLAGHRRTDRP